jgi:hypothetical protein
LINFYWEAIVIFYNDYAEQTMNLSPETGYKNNMIMTQLGFVKMVRWLGNNYIDSLNTEDLLSCFTDSI